MKFILTILLFLICFFTKGQILSIITENDTAKIFNPHTGQKSAIVTSSPATFSIGTVNSTSPLTIANSNAIPIAPQSGTLQQLISNGIAGRISNDTYSSGTNGSIFQGRRADGTPSSPSAALSGMVLAGINGDGYGTSSFTGSGLGSLTIRAEENFTNTSKATNLQFTTTPTGSISQVERMRIKSTGALQLFTYGAGFGKFDASGNLTSSALVSGDIPNIAQSQVTNLVSDLTNKQNTITLTTIGTSGASTLVGSTLNIPSYSSGGSGFNYSQIKLITNK